jgi:CheY-like chemotaxis protein
MRLRILIIDDEESLRETFKWHLESLGHEVIVLPDPRPCAAYMRKPCTLKKPCADILIVDYNMPHMNGIELLELMEESGCLFPDYHKMILTGDATRIDHAAAKRLGCVIRQKPLRLADLEIWVDSIAQQIPADRKLADLSEIASH